VQIGGGVRVSDAFQAIVGLKLIAIWGRRLCVEVSQAGHHVSFVSNKRNTHQPNLAAPNAERVDGEYGRTEEHGKQLNGLERQTLPMEFDTHLE
jgi:hypothetical protein